ncbi:hypothetical protein OESDEN_02539 [Oesophagostomum dentatum]|uniref:Uncharacterized protein n=1 Tax=Oesophagostomum dentatum TaxID=61180 RepID=A0A0B1TQ01_OESDE|nr:hypothetical protein OESDEN_02539 [Oesophagostomum dentatum]
MLMLYHIVGDVFCGGNEMLFLEAEKTLHCDFNLLINDYKILRLSTNDISDFANKLSFILRERNVSKSSIEYIKTSVLSRRTNHTTIGTRQQKETREAIMSSPYLMDLLVKMFYYDFTLFGYPLPDMPE